MKRIALYLQLVRWPNLVIIALTQFLVWYSLLRPLSDLHPESFFLTTFHFSLLSLATVTIAAAGYIINDYFDQAIDLINKPDKTIIGISISKKQAMKAYTLLNALGLGLSIYLAGRLRLPALLFLQAGCIGLLWWYAFTLKRTYLWGNLAVSVLTALSLLVLPAYEPVFYTSVPMPEPVTTAGLLIVLYAFFAFMLTGMREITKDVQDRKGDAAAGCQTLPIQSGKAAANRWLIGLSWVTIIALAILAGQLWSHSRVYLSVYVLLALICPLAYLSVPLSQPQTDTFYKRLSKLLKVLMLLGLIPLLLHSLWI